MSKKILILNGSPRAKGNTKALIEAFEKGAAGHHVERFDLQVPPAHVRRQTLVQRPDGGEVVLVLSLR